MNLVPVNKFKALEKLKHLKSQIGLAGEKGLRARIEFLAIVFIHQLKTELTAYQFFDEHNIGERDFDTCFEMNDGNLVVHGLIKETLKNNLLNINLQEQLGITNYSRWRALYESLEPINNRASTDASEGQLALSL